MRSLQRCASCIAIAAFAITVFCAATTDPKSNTQIFQEWLTAFNNGDPTGLAAFYQDYLGKPNIAFALDSREETGGFVLDKIESDGEQQLSVLVRERDRGALWRVVLIRNTEGNPVLRTINFLPLPGSQNEALAALSAFGDKLAALDKFSGVIEIVKGNNTIFAKSWGMADRARQIPITLETPFYFASQGKMFTSVAILQLVQSGKISLDDPIGKYLTDYPNAKMAKVTIRQLLSHQGGAGEMGILEPQDGANRETVHSIEDIIALNGNRAPEFPPGSSFNYSNYGYLLLGAVVERVSGQSYYDYVRAHIFEPAGMSHTGFPLREETEMAIPYTTKDGPLRSASDQLPWRGTPAGGGDSTAADMQSFVAALNAGKLLSLGLLSEATKQHVKQGFGYGFISSGLPEFLYWGHGGGAEGMSLVLSYYPVNNTTFVCESNRDPPICDRLAFNYLFRSPKTP